MAVSSTRTWVPAFMVLVGGIGVFLVGQWLVTKLGSGTPVDIAEWPFVAVGLLLAAFPLAAAAGLWLERDWGGRFARIAAWLATLAGAVALTYAVMLLSMGVAWGLLIGGAVLLVGGIGSLLTLRR